MAHENLTRTKDMGMINTTLQTEAHKKRNQTGKQLNCNASALYFTIYGNPDALYAGDGPRHTQQLIFFCLFISAGGAIFFGRDTRDTVPVGARVHGRSKVYQLNYLQFSFSFY